jgi:Leu/Phe-tRNA-protein transferase
MEIKKFTKFPAPESANQDGLVAIGGILDTDLLLSAYLQGIFSLANFR